MSSRYLAIMVWISAELLLQIHGICFWLEHGGLHGWLWSVVLCVATVWFWLHHKPVIRYTFGVVASLLLLAGPLWQVGAPLVDAIEQRNAQQRNVALQVETLRNSEALQVATLQTFLRNSEARTGWAPLIVTAQDDLAMTRERLAVVSTAPPKARATFLSVAVIVIQLLALVVLQVAAVAALLVIRCGVGASMMVLPDQKSAERFTRERVAPAGASSSTKKSKSSITPDEAAAIKQRIMSGQYGVQPVVRDVMVGEDKRHPVIKSIFDDLITVGVLVLEGRRVRLVSQ